MMSSTFQGLGDQVDTWFTRLLPLMVVIVLVGTVVVGVRGLRQGARMASPLVLVPTATGCPGGAPGCDTRQAVLAGDELFSFDSSELQDVGVRRVAEVAATMQRAGVEQVLVVGHADRLGPTPAKDRLAAARAQRVRNELASKLPAATVSSIGAGDRLPLTRRDDCQPAGGAAERACLAKDRRVEIWWRPAAASAAAAASAPAPSTAPATSTAPAAQR